MIDAICTVTLVTFRMLPLLHQEPLPSCNPYGRLSGLTVDSQSSPAVDIQHKTQILGWRIPQEHNSWGSIPVFHDIAVVKRSPVKYSASMCSQNRLASGLFRLLVVVPGALLTGMSSGVGRFNGEIRDDEDARRRMWSLLMAKNVDETRAAIAMFLVP